MKILVCISKAPDTTTKIEFADNKFKTDGVTWIMNPTDEWYALVRAVELKEQLGGTVTVINVGGTENDQIIRKALAIGADDAIRVDAEASDSFFVANQIAHQAKDANYDIIFTGKEAIDYNGFVVGGMIAELLDLPYISLAAKLETDGTKATLEREIEGGKETLEVSGSFVVSCQKGMAEQRIPNMRGIMSARTKPLTVVASNGEAGLSTVTSYELPAQKEAVKLIDAENVEELVKLLHEEAKVI